MLEIIVTAGGFSSLLLQGFKWLWRKLIAKDMLYEFPAGFYEIAIPVLNILVIPVLAFVGFSGFAMPTDWMGWVRSALQVLIASAISLVTYNGGIKPLTTYREEVKAKRLLVQK